MTRIIRQLLSSSHALIFPLLCALALVAVMPAAAQNADAPTETETTAQVPTEPEPLTESLIAKLDALQNALPEQRAKIVDLEKRVTAGEGLAIEILNIRLDLAWLGLLEDTLAFAEAVVAQEEDGFVISGYSGDVIDALGDQLNIATTAINRTKASVKIPAPDQSATDQAAAYARVFKALDVIDQVYEVFSSGIEVSRRFNLDVSKSEEMLRNGLNDRAVNTSVFLEMSVRDISALRAALTISPEDAEIKSAILGAERRLQSTADELNRITGRMESLDMSTDEYRAQILASTGEITTDLFNFSVIGNLLSKAWQSTFDTIAAEGPSALFKLLLFLLIVYAAKKFANIVEKLVKRGLSSSTIRMSRLLERMIISTISNIVLIVGVLIALSQLGISLGPLLAGLGIAGFVIGFALQDTLSNFASGMMILFYKPFDVGDFVEAGGIMGKVSSMTLVNTTILTIDNQTVIVPNNMIWQGIIKNVTGQRIRRVDLLFGVSYSDDIAKVEKVLHDIIAANDKILDEPESQIHLHELADSSVNFVVRPWVKTDDYWDVYWELMRAVKIRFDEESISIPFPQRDVHHYSEVPANLPGTT
jgi:small conductance mechanosensitive channel